MERVSCTHHISNTEIRRRMAKDKEIINTINKWLLQYLQLDIICEMEALPCVLQGKVNSMRRRISSWKILQTGSTWNLLRIETNLNLKRIYRWCGKRLHSYLICFWSYFYIRRGCFSIFELEVQYRLIHAHAHSPISKYPPISHVPVN